MPLTFATSNRDRTSDAACEAKGMFAMFVTSFVSCAIVHATSRTFSAFICMEGVDGEVDVISISLGVRRRLYLAMELIGRISDHSYSSSESVCQVIISDKDAGPSSRKRGLIVML